jgi:hypothetical protein
VGAVAERLILGLTAAAECHPVPDLIFGAVERSPLGINPHSSYMKRSGLSIEFP